MSFKKERGGGGRDGGGGGGELCLERPCLDDREFMTVQHSDSECHISGWLCTDDYEVGCVLP